MLKNTYTAYIERILSSSSSFSPWSNLRFVRHDPCHSPQTDIGPGTAKSSPPGTIPLRSEEDVKQKGVLAVSTKKNRPAKPAQSTSKFLLLTVLYGH